jgi:heme A synthase
LNRQTFVRYAWFVVALNLLVIVWGVVVRATGAGAGCGDHWPLCNGAVIPPAPQLKTLIEYGHRLTSGVALLFVTGLVYFAFRSFPKSHPVRRMAVLSLTFELTEALIGAGLVLLGHVAGNTSVNRGYTLSFHLVNTLLLLAALSLTAWFAGHSPKRGIEGRTCLPTVLALLALGLLVVGISGGIAALGDTLFASHSLAEGWRQDFSASSHPFVRLRIWHPILAAVFGMALLGLAAYTFSAREATTTTRRLGIGLMLVVVAQLCLGVVNLELLAPVPIQLLHLFLADLLWITFVLLTVELLWPSELPEATSRGSASEEMDNQRNNRDHEDQVNQPAGNMESCPAYQPDAQ